MPWASSSAQDAVGGSEVAGLLGCGTGIDAGLDLRMVSAARLVRRVGAMQAALADGVGVARKQAEYAGQGPRPILERGIPAAVQFRSPSRRAPTAPPGC
jgi:hypothetical protein